MVYMLMAANSKIYFLFARFCYHEASMIASGISYRAKNEKSPEEYNSLRSVDITGFHWGETAKDSIANWNMRT